MEESEFNYINVIPFIDIMLVLLTIVLTTSTFIARGAIPIALPQAGAKQVETLKTLSIEIDKQGTIYFDARPTTLAALCSAIDSSSRETQILIRADRECSLQYFVDLMDAVQSLGFSQVSLQTETR